MKAKWTCSLNPKWGWFSHQTRRIWMSGQLSHLEYIPCQEGQHKRSEAYGQFSTKKKRREEICQILLFSKWTFSWGTANSQKGQCILRPYLKASTKWQKRQFLPLKDEKSSSSDLFLYLKSILLENTQGLLEILSLVESWVTKPIKILIPITNSWNWSTV